MSRKKSVPITPQTSKVGPWGAQSRADSSRKKVGSGAKKDSLKQPPRMLKSGSARTVEHTERLRSRDKSLARVDNSVTADKAVRMWPLTKNKLETWEKLQSANEQFRRKVQKISGQNALLKEKLATARGDLQSTIESRDILNQNLQFANAQLQHANEELEVTTEELRAANEELAKTNQELEHRNANVNRELKERNVELAGVNLELKRRNDDLINLLSSVNLPIVMLGSDLRIRQFTTLAQTLFSLSPTSLGNPISEIQSSLPISELEPMILDVIDTPGNKEMELQDAQGRWYSIRIRPYKTKDNQIDGAVILAIDITQRKRAETEHVQLLAREQEARKEAELARAQAEAANRAKDEFLATVSHELRTPLNAILGWASLLSTANFDKAVTTRGLETIVRNAKAQAQIIEDLLDVSRIISGRLRLNVREIELPSIIKAVMDSLRLAADSKGIRLQTELASQSRPISGDPDRLQQVTWNLLSNSIKFTPTGGNVQVRLEELDSHIQLTVSDTGKGIAPEFLPRVFNRFSQADSSITRKQGGLGLGLAIVRHLVELHGGTIRAQSPGEGQGATFVVRLPLSPVYSEQSGSEPGYPVASGKVPVEYPPVLSGLQILAVDDEPDVREFLAVCLEKSGAEVRAVASAAEALEVLKRWQPSVLVADIGMPEEDGYTLIQKIRTHELGGLARIPAVALTAYAQAEDRRQALSAGYQVHVPKPVEPAELIAVIADLARHSSESSVNLKPAQGQP
jgi:signal transduction histidine kinase/CheY-like chemotaxis protein